MISIRQLSPLKIWILAASAVFIFVLCNQAFAAAGGKPGAASEALFLIQIVVLVVAGRLLGEAMVRIGQPSIMGQIIAGILLGPSFFGALMPEWQAMLFPPLETQVAMTEAVAQLGILFLLLLAGMETDLALAIRLKRSAAEVSIAGIVVPFALGFALGEYLPDALLPDPDARLVTSLFLGTALSISSVKIVASVVREMDFMRRNVGQLIVASAIIDDTLGWVIIAVTFSLAEHDTVDMMTLAKSVFGTLAFMAFSFTIGRRIVFEIIRWTNDKFRSDLPVLSAIIAIMGGMAIITNAIGVHTVLGAFVAGILVGQSPILTRQIDGQLRALTTALFMPVFFGLTGLHTDLTVLLDPTILLLAIGLILIASLGKFGGAFAGAKMGGLTNAEAVALGCGMNARGSTEVIVASIGLSVGVLDQRLFSVIVAMAVVTTMIMPPTLRWALARLPMREEERDRLESEEFEEKSFMSNFERILLVIDQSASSRLATRIASHFAAVRKMPVTVLNVDEHHQAPEDADAPDAEAVAKIGQAKSEEVADRIRTTAKEAVASGGEEAQVADGDIHVTTMAREGDLPKALREGSSQGHDLLLIGIEPTVSHEGGYNEKLTEMTSAFDGTAAIVSARARLPDVDKDLRILVPVSGTERSAKAAEFAIVIAKATGCAIAVIFVREPTQARSVPRVSEERNAHIAAFERIDEVARYYEVDVKKIVQGGTSPELSILRHSRQGRYNLIVLGVSRRVGSQLSYGGIADTLIEAADRSVIFIETQQ